MASETCWATWKCSQTSRRTRCALYTLVTGNTQIPAEYPDRVRHLVDSFGQDIIYGVTPGLKPPKQILLPYAKQCSTYPDATPMWAWDRSFAWNYQAIYQHNTGVGFEWAHRQVFHSFFEFSQTFTCQTFNPLDVQGTQLPEGLRY